MEWEDKKLRTLGGTNLTATPPVRRAQSTPDDNSVDLAVPSHENLHVCNNYYNIIFLSIIHFSQTTKSYCTEEHICLK